MSLLTFRDAIKRVSPPWLRIGNAEKIMYTFGAQIDALIDATVAGVKLRFPGLYSAESLPWIGRDRRILRGRDETDQVYASRLVRWLDDHASRGGPYALLAQLFAHYAVAPFAIQLVYASGRYFELDTTGNVTMGDLTWSPDSDSARWARWWAFYSWPVSIGDDGLWGSSGTYGDGGTWGSTLSISDVTDIRAVPKEWNAAHAQGKVVVLSPGAEFWGVPAGVWGDPGVWGGGSAVALGIG